MDAELLGPIGKWTLEEGLDEWKKKHGKVLKQVGEGAEEE